jgi:hypothetical protein
MAGATSKLQILIEAKNSASPVLKQIANDAGGLEKSLSGIGAALSGAIAGIGAAQVAAMVVDMAKAGAEAERLGGSFDTLAQQAGESGDAMLAAMRDAAQGTIADSELMLSANRAMLLGVADSADEMAKLLEVAAARGKAMGETTAQAFSDLVTGIGRMSPMILDNLGITIDAAKANEIYAESIGKTVAQLSDAEQKQALLNAVIQSSTSLVQANKDAGNDAASNFERMDAAITNAKEALGELFSPAVAAIAQQLAVAVTKVTADIKEMQQPVAESAQELAVLDQTIMGLNNDIGQIENGMRRLSAAGQQNSDAYRDLEAQLIAAKAALAATGVEMATVGVAANAADLATRSLTTSTQASANSLPAYQASLAATARALEETALMANLAQEAFSRLRAEQTSGSNAIAQAAASAGALFAGKLGGDAGLGKQKAVTEELNAQRQIWKDMHYTDKEINDVLLPGMIQSMNEADRATFKVATSTAKISDEARAAQQAFDDLTNTVAGVLSGALDPGVGVDPDDLLPRQDAVNEDARRLADVAVNGWASPWAEYFRNTFPEQFMEMTASNDIKTGAAIMLRNFQDGLEPELLSKEKVKERVRKMLVGDQNMAALATEIATELSQEMGVPMQEALAATQGAMGGGTGMGTEAATSFADGASAALDEGNGGGAFVTKFTEQMKASYSLLSQAGKDAGKLWGANFLEVVGENVPPALIKILVDLTTPGVIAALAQKGSLTGATP